MTSEKITISRKSNDFGIKLSSLRKNKKFCDATLIVNGERIAVHKFVLAAPSVFFEKKFFELKSNEIPFPNVNKEAMKNMIDFCYTGTIEIDESKLKEAITMANKLSIHSFIDICTEIFEKRLSIETSISIWKFSKSGQMEKLKQIVLGFIEKNFEEISKLSEFLTLEYSDMHIFFSSDMIVYPMIIYEALMKWINFDVNSRLKNLNDLLTYVPLSCLLHDFLFSELRSLLNSNFPCALKFLDALKKQENDQFRNCYTQSTLIAVGENSASKAKKMEVYDIVDKKWIIIKDMDLSYEDFMTILSNDELILVGGYENKNNVSSYDIKTGTISPMPSLVHGRDKTSVVQVEDNIYAINGFDTNSVERYDPISKSWSEVESMKTPCINCHAAVIDNKIYVMGGYENDVFFNITARYNQLTNSWKYLKPMYERRAYFAVAVIGKLLYVVGGENDRGYLNSAERYDATLDQWTMITSSNFERVYSAAGNFNGKLVVAGGFTDGSGNKVEIYDESKKEWNSMPSLNISRYSFSLISVSIYLAQHLLSRKA